MKREITRNCPKFGITRCLAVSFVGRIHIAVLYKLSLNQFTVSWVAIIIKNIWVLALVHKMSECIYGKQVVENS